MKTIFKLAIAGAAMVAAAGNANAADILTVTQVQAAYTQAPKADITGPAYFHDNAKVSPLKVTGTLNSSAVELFAYCVDIFQGVGTGNFEVVSLLDYLGGNVAKAKTVARLIGAEGGSLATLLGKEHDASVQMAVWELFTETAGNPLDVTGNAFFVSDTNAALTGNANGFLAAAGAGQVNPLLKLYVAKSAGKQDMLFWTYSPAVPEPATWAMMIVGMGAIGASLRQARRKTTVRFA